MLISFVVVLFLNANTTSSHQGTSRFGHLAKGLRLKSLVKSASRRSCRLDWLGPSIRPEDASNGWSSQLAADPRPCRPMSPVIRRKAKSSDDDGDAADS